MRVLFVHQGLQSFVQKDLDILRSAHQVRELHFAGLKDVPAVWQGAAWADVTFSWFGKLHTFFAVLFSKLLGKKAVVVAGGDQRGPKAIDSESPLLYESRVFNA